MAFVWDQIRTGAWLTAARMRDYATILLIIYAAAAVLWIALADGMVDRNNKPIGTDFSNVYAAGKLTLSGKAAAAYNWQIEHAVEKATFGGRDVPFYGWHYPPIFLVVAAVLALLPYGWALALWMAATLPAYLMTIRAIVPRRMAMIIALAYPAVFINFGHGQNGFISAALLGSSLLLLDSRPILSGILIGFLAYKPQFGLLIPIVLMATGRWAVIAAAGMTVIALCAATAAAFGSKVWLAFLDSTALTREIVLEAGSTGWERIQSIFSAVRMWGGTIEMAYAAQCALTLTVAVALVWVSRSKSSSHLKSAALAASTLIATPYVLDYDLMILGIALAFFARHCLEHGFHDYEISTLSFVWTAPLLSRLAGSLADVPLGLMAQVMLFAAVLLRAYRDVRAPQPAAAWQTPMLHLHGRELRNAE